MEIGEGKKLVSSFFIKQYFKSQFNENPKVLYYLQLNRPLILFKFKFIHVSLHKFIIFIVDHNTKSNRRQPNNIFCSPYSYFFHFVEILRTITKRWLFVFKHNLKYIYNIPCRFIEYPNSAWAICLFHLLKKSQYF